MTGIMILRAPSTSAANTAETAINSGSVFGVAVQLGLRSGRYLVVLCASGDKPTLLTECYARSWDVLAHGSRVAPAALLEDPEGLLAYVSGLLDERGA